MRKLVRPGLAAASERPVGEDRVVVAFCRRQVWTEWDEPAVEEDLWAAFTLDGGRARGAPARAAELTCRQAVIP